MEQRNSKWNATFFWEQVELEEYSIYSVYSTSESGIVGRAGIARIVMIDSSELWTFIPE